MHSESRCKELERQLESYFTPRNVFFALQMLFEALFAKLLAVKMP